MKIIIAGSRTITDYHLIEEAFEKSGFGNSILGFCDTEIISGCAPGIDTLAIEFAENHGYTIKTFPADWDNLTVLGAIIREGKFGKYNANAGKDRNIQMANYADALIAITNGSPGTAHMISEATKRKLRVYVMNVI